MSDISEITGDADTLLRLWFEWWRDTDEAPAKMPDSLHVRTALYLDALDRASSGAVSATEIARLRRSCP